MFRRAAIHAALGSARSFYAHLKKWRTRRAKMLAKGKQFLERPPVAPRSWNKPATFYFGQWKERKGSSILLKVWTGSCWSWLKVRLTGRELPNKAEAGSPSLVRRGKQWWLHTPAEKQFQRPPKIEAQVTTNAATRICAVDLNLNEHLAVCTVQTVEGTILATRFIGGGREISGFRKRQLGRIARNRAQTGIIAENEQDNAVLWRKIRNADEHIAHLVSARIVQFTQEQGASILARYQKPFKEKPPAPVRRAGRVEKSTGVAFSQEAKRKKGPSLSDAWHGDDNAHGTAQEGTLWMDERPSAIPPQLRLPLK